MENDMIIDIEEMRNKEGPLLSTSNCIYRVPGVIREHNPQAYTPKVVSIGPFHHKKRGLKRMKTRKQKYFNQFIETVGDGIWDKLVSLVKDSTSKVRACYSDDISFSEKKLVMVILMDAIFIIELFMISYKGPYDDIVRSPSMLGNIQMDLLLLENQLPFFILEELYDLALPSETRGEFPSFRKLTFYFFSDLNRNHWEDHYDVSINHFTDLFRAFYLYHRRKKNNGEEFDYKRSNNISYGARELYEAGVGLKKANKRKFLLKLKFSRNILEIPEILVDGNFEILFRNMIALEKCYYPNKAYITHYAFFLASLIQNGKDVDVLIHEEIIVNCLTKSKDVVQLFNGLCKDVTVPIFNSDYFELCEKLNAAYKDRWNNLKASLRSDYCRTPWQTLVSIGGIIIVVLTAVQTICSVISIVKHI